MCLRRVFFQNRFSRRYCRAWVVSFCCKSVLRENTGVPAPFFFANSFFGQRLLCLLRLFCQSVFHEDVVVPATLLCKSVFRESTDLRMPFFCKSVFRENMTVHAPCFVCLFFCKSVFRESAIVPAPFCFAKLVF